LVVGAALRRPFPCGGVVKKLLTGAALAGALALVLSVAGLAQTI
jgi:hypothetical protein